jgi:hypothetical protein
MIAAVPLWPSAAVNTQDPGDGPNFMSGFGLLPDFIRQIKVNGSSVLALQLKMWSIELRCVKF